MITGLPQTLTVDGIERPIYADFRNIIKICIAFSDCELSQTEKLHIMLSLLYQDSYEKFYNIEEAIKQAMWFIDWGKEYDNKVVGPKIMDWEQDYNLIISAVNQKASVIDVRELPFMHWWTFLGYFSDRGECQFSSITEIREKLAKGKKLEKWERDILHENRDLIILEDKEDLEDDIWR